MGGPGYIAQAREARENLLGQIVRSEFKYLVTIFGIDGDTGKKIERAYNLFKELNEEEIRGYVDEVSKRDRIKPIKINIYSLQQPKLIRELSV